jgi:hypothetical protein
MKFHSLFCRFRLPVGHISETVLQGELLDVPRRRFAVPTVDSKPFAVRAYFRYTGGITLQYYAPVVLMDNQGFAVEIALPAILRG